MSARILFVFVLSGLLVAPVLADDVRGPLIAPAAPGAVDLWMESSADELHFEIDFDDGSFVERSVAVEDGLVQTRLGNLPPGAHAVLSVGEVQVQFNVPPLQERQVAVNFVFGSCLGGQGECRRAEGWPIFDAMSELDPELFVFLGDTIYADGECPSPPNLPGGEVAATDLPSLLQRYRWQLEDPRYSAFLARTPVLAVWDDHELADDIGLPELSAARPDYAAAADTAFRASWPLPPSRLGGPGLARSLRWGRHLELWVLDTRSFRDPTPAPDLDPTSGASKSMLGEEQMAWLKNGLLASNATWKIVATTAPLSWPTGWPEPELTGRDGWANGSLPSGYETELGELFFFVMIQKISGFLVISGDTHFPSAIAYDLDRDGRDDVLELSASPISGGVVDPPPAGPDPTFGPRVLYSGGIDSGTAFGQLAIDSGGHLVASIHDQSGKVLYSLELEP